MCIQDPRERDSPKTTALNGHIENLLSRIFWKMAFVSILDVLPLSVFAIGQFATAYVLLVSHQLRLIFMLLFAIKVFHCY